MRFFTICALLALSISSSSYGQDTDFHQIMRGPFGRPLAVRDESGNWSVPILVYADSDVEMFVPDITGPGWLSWHVEAYRQSGQYTVPLYEYYKTDHLCPQKLPQSAHPELQHTDACKNLAYTKRQMTVYTRNQTVTVGPLLLMESDAFANPLNETGSSKTFALSAIGPRTRKALAHASEIVADGSLRYTGVTAREAMAQDQETVRKMANNAFAHDCAPYSDSQAWKSWHGTGCPPRTSTRTPQNH